MVPAGSRPEQALVAQHQLFRSPPSPRSAAPASLSPGCARHSRSMFRPDPDQPPSPGREPLSKGARLTAASGGPTSCLVETGSSAAQGEGWPRQLAAGVLAKALQEPRVAVGGFPCQRVLEEGEPLKPEGLRDQGASGLYLQADLFPCAARDAVVVTISSPFSGAARCAWYMPPKLGFPWILSCEMSLFNGLRATFVGEKFARPLAHGAARTGAGGRGQVEGRDCSWAKAYHISVFQQ